MLTALLLGALSFTPLQEQVLEAALHCGTADSAFTLQSHYAGCEGRVCRGQDGRPLLPDEQLYDSPGGFFVLHYTTSGSNTVSLQDDDKSGVPDYVEKVAAAFDSALEAYRVMGFIDPQPDAFGPDSRYDVYLSYLAGFGGVAWQDADDTEGSRYDAYPSGTPTFIAINPQQHAAALAVFPEWVADVLIEQVAAHELHHAIQRSYSTGFGSWIFEGMSVMMEQIVVDVPYRMPFVTNFRYQPRYGGTNEALFGQGTSPLAYANGLFYQSLVPDLGGPGGYVAYWEALGKADLNLTVGEWVEAGLEAAGAGTLPEALRKYAVRSLFLDEFDDGDQFPDGFRYHAGGMAKAVLDGAGTVNVPYLDSYSFYAIRLEGPAEGQMSLQASAASGLPPFEADFVMQFADCSTSVAALAFDAGAAGVTAPAGLVRGWIVLRANGSSPATPFTLAVDYTSEPVVPSVTGLSTVRLPATAATGVAVPLVARLAYSDCRVEDVSARANWTVDRPALASIEPGYRLFGHWKGPVEVGASYNGHSTNATIEFDGPVRPVPQVPADDGGCSQSGRGDAGFAILAGALWAFVRLGRRS